jgi:hypothetical protein
MFAKKLTLMFKKILFPFLLLISLFAFNSCTKKCSEGKEGLDCNENTLSKFTGIWNGKSCDGVDRQVTIESTGAVSVNIKNLFAGQVFSIKGSVNFTTINVEPNQTVADGIILQECIIQINPDQKINIAYKLQDNTSNPARLTECSFIGTKSGSNTNTNIPQLITSPVITIDDSTASSGGTIVSNAGTISKSGVCWSTSPNPTIDGGANSTSDLGNPFESIISGLLPGNTYYIRAYAVNEAGTGYGQEIQYYKAACKGALCIGSEYQGGIIAYFLEQGDPGYVANDTNGYLISLNEFDAAWGCLNISVGNTSINEFEGDNNTTNILNKCNEPNIAAKQCRNLGNGWFLPSLNEFERAVSNLGSGAFQSNAIYWTSSEETSNLAWVYSISGNPTNKATVSKNNFTKVRAFKKF